MVDIDVWLLNYTSYELCSYTYANTLFNYSVQSISLVNLKKLIFKSSLEKACSKCGYCCLVSLIPLIFPDLEMRHLPLFFVKSQFPSYATLDPRLIIFKNSAYVNKGKKTTTHTHTHNAILMIGTISSCKVTWCLSGRVKRNLVMRMWFLSFRY